MTTPQGDHCEVLCLNLPQAEALRAARLTGEEAVTFAERAQALSDPTRVTVAIALRDGGELCVCDLAWILERSQNLVSHHLRALRVRGLARARRDGKMAMYSLTPDGVALVEALVGATARVPA